MHTMNINILIPLILLTSVKGQRIYQTDSSDKRRGGFSDWVINDLNTSSTDAIWKKGFLSRFMPWRPIASYDHKYESNFITFDSQDTQMTLDLNLGFPFIRVPVVNTTNILNLAKDLSRRERPLINFDLAAIVMVGIVSVISFLFSFTLRAFFAPLRPREPSKNKRNARSASENFEDVWNIFTSLNNALMRYGVNPNVCMQRMTCIYVKNAVIDKKLRPDSTRHINKIIEGLSRSDWALEYIEGTSLEYAISVGRSEKDCQRLFKKCDPNNWFFYTHSNPANNEDFY